MLKEGMYSTRSTKIRSFVTCGKVPQTLWYSPVVNIPKYHTQEPQDLTSGGTWVTSTTEAVAKYHNIYGTVLLLLSENTTHISQYNRTTSQKHKNRHRNYSKALVVLPTEIIGYFSSHKLKLKIR